MVQRREMFIRRKNKEEKHRWYKKKRGNIYVREKRNQKKKKSAIRNFMRLHNTCTCEKKKKKGCEEVYAS